MRGQDHLIGHVSGYAGSSNLVGLVRKGELGDVVHQGNRVTGTHLPLQRGAGLPGP